MNTYELQEELTEGTFIKECKTRFLCEVSIANKIQYCYVPSSAKLGQFLNLKNKKVLLTSNTNKSKTKYSLWSVYYRKKQILLNLQSVNNIIEHSIKNNYINIGNYSSIHREKTIDNYKCDLFLSTSEEKMIVEIKTIISTNKIAYFPTLNTKRAVEQLIKIKTLLRTGYKVTYILVSLSPFVKEIYLNNSFTDFTTNFEECINLGMELLLFSLELKNNSIIISKNIKLSLN